jgi:hypothetical protein
MRAAAAVNRISGDLPDVRREATAIAIGVGVVTCAELDTSAELAHAAVRLRAPGDR